MERIELSSSRCKREVLPLNDIPTNWYQRMESNHLLRAYQTRAQPESFAGMEVSARIELASQRYKCCASPAMLADHKSLEPRPRIERGSHLYQRCTLPLSYQGWSQGGESNSGRSVTSALLSTELPGNGASDRIRTGVYCMARSNLAAGRHPQEFGAECEIELTSGFGRPSPHWTNPAW